ncbi:MAG: hypothetical protein RIQ88_613 [Actinomycetota bacterium]|jgi:hypothetical protein
MAKKAAPDALDLLAADYEHAGRHRARRTAKDRWIELAWLALASAILSASGLFGLQYASSLLSNPQPTHRYVNGVDLSTPITVIDGSGTRSFASRVGQLLLDQDLVVPYSRTIDQSFASSSIRIQKEEYRALAKKMQAIIGLLPIEVKADSKYPIEARLGADYIIPEEK